MAANPVFRQIPRQPDELEEVGEMDHSGFFREVKMGRTVPGWKKNIRRSQDHLVVVKSRQYGRGEKEYITDTSKLEMIAQQSAILDALESRKKNNPPLAMVIRGLEALYGGRGNVPLDVMKTAYDERYKANDASITHSFKELDDYNYGRY